LGFRSIYIGMSKIPRISNHRTEKHASAFAIPLAPTKRRQEIARNTCQEPRIILLAWVVIMQRVSETLIVESEAKTKMSRFEH
jgi:hypothetical protein